MNSKLLLVVLVTFMTAVVYLYCYQWLLVPDFSFAILSGNLVLTQPTHSLQTGPETRNVSIVPNIYFNRPCFHSPYIICRNSSTQETEMTHKIANISADMRETLLVTTLLDSTLHIRDSEYNFSSCPYPCAYISRENVSKAKGIIVDASTVREHHLPKERRDGQVYILVGLESPVNYRGSLLQKSGSKFTDQINYIATYRVDSDLPQLYSHLYFNDQPRKTKGELARLYRRKTRMAAWFVSNCNATSKRNEYVKELQKYMEIDIYGQCGTKKIMGSERQLLTTTYKFYLSFENSLCKDYVTEKFFKLFAPGVYVIPVVRGGADYHQYFPTGTFINTADFVSPKQLAQFLQLVASDSEKYVKFLEIRDGYTMERHSHKTRQWLCDICEVLHTSDSTKLKRKDNIKEWLSHDVCHPAKDVEYRETRDVTYG